MTTGVNLRCMADGHGTDGTGTSYVGIRARQFRMHVVYIALGCLVDGLVLLCSLIANLKTYRGRGPPLL